MAAERPAQSWGFASEMRAEEATRGGDGGGDPQTLAVPRPPLPGPEDVLPNGEENSHGDRRLGTMPSSRPSPSSISTLRFPGTFLYFPTFPHDIWEHQPEDLSVPRLLLLLIGGLQPSKGFLEPGGRPKPSVMSHNTRSSLDKFFSLQETQRT